MTEVTERYDNVKPGVATIECSFMSDLVNEEQRQKEKRMVFLL